MPGLARIHLIWAAALAALLACPVAGALPPSDSSGRAVSAGAAAGSPDEQPLQVLVPPANDPFAGAVAVTGLPYTTTLSTVEATAAADDPLCLGSAASVWYAFTTPITTWVAADTFGSDFDTTLSAYTGVQGGLTQLTCDDDAGGATMQSRVVFLASPGETYYLMAAGKGGGGSLVLSLDVRSPLDQIGVRTTRAYEAYPAAGPDHLAWAQWPRRNGQFWTAFVQRTGEPRDAVNRPRTSGFPGGFEGDTFVFQEVHVQARPRRSSIVFYDLVNGTRSSPPAGVNTDAWEWSPSISGDWLLFGRQQLGQRRDFVFLRNLVTGETILLDRIAWKRRQGAAPNQVSGNYAVWHRCTPWCNVFLYDIAAGTTTRITNQANRHHYFPSVTDDGTVYFLRSGRGCGASVRLVRRAPGGGDTVLARFPQGWDSGQTRALENADGTTSLFYDRVHCRTSAWDVLKVVDP